MPVQNETTTRFIWKFCTVASKKYRKNGVESGPLFNFPYCNTQSTHYISGMQKQFASAVPSKWDIRSNELREQKNHASGNSAIWIKERRSFDMAHGTRCRFPQPFAVFILFRKYLKCNEICSHVHHLFMCGNVGMSMMQAAEKCVASVSSKQTTMEKAFKYFWRTNFEFNKLNCNLFSNDEYSLAILKRAEAKKKKMFQIPFSHRWIDRHGNNIFKYIYFSIAVIIIIIIMPSGKR